MSEIIEANIKVHTRLADTYDQVEPHFRPENRAKVRRILESLRAEVGGRRMLDLGCGTGFMIGLAADLFDEIHGVDVTQAMLDRVDRSSGKVTLHNAPAERTPYPDGHFDLVTAYSFIHHTKDYRAILREAARVLRPGGRLYVDLEPNKLFWTALEGLANADKLSPVAPLVAKNYQAALKVDERIEQEYGIAKDVFRQAEYGKAMLGGIDPNDLRREYAQLGFTSVEVELHWFLGEAEVLHGRSAEEAAAVDRYLRSVAPLSDALFKYIRAIYVK